MARNLRWKICSVGCAIKDCHLLSTISCLAISCFLLGTFSHYGGEVPFYFASSPSFLHPSPSCQIKISDVFPKMSIVFWIKSDVFEKISDVFEKISDTFLYSLRRFPFLLGISWTLVSFFLKNTQCFWQLLDNSYFCNYHFLTFSLWLLQDRKNYMISDLLSCEDLV